MKTYFAERGESLANNNGDGSRLSIRIFRILINICFVFTILCGIYGFVVSPHMGLFDQKAHLYDGDWVYEDEQGNQTVFKMPYDLKLQPGQKIIVKTTLPEDINDGDYICFSTGKDFRVLIDDEEIFSFEASTSKMPGKIVKAVYFPVRLCKDYAGRTLTLVKGEKGDSNGNMHACYIGGLLGVMREVADGRAIQFLGAILLSIASIVTAAVFLYISFNNRKVMPLIYLAQGVTIISLWIMFDSFVFQLMFDNYFVDGVLAYMLVMLMPIPFVYYFNNVQNYRHYKAYMCINIMAIANYAVLTVLHMAGIHSYEDMLVHINAFTILYIVIFFVVAVKDYFIDGNKEHVRVIIGFFGMCFMAIVEVCVVIVKTLTHLTFKVDGVFILIGLYILLFFAILDQIDSLNELKAATQEAMAATRAKSEFLANMSHEIRTPINAIMGMNEMILREAKQDKVLEYARDVDSASRNLLDIVNDILDFSKIESGMLEIIVEEYNLGELIYDVTNLVSIKARDKGLKLKILVNPEMPYMLRGDEKRIREIITNILNNAVKYTDRGSIELKVDGDVNDDRLTLMISVSDTGQGIREEDIDKIFAGFERVNIKKNKHIEGTGLGLTITKNIVEAMDGTIGVESEYGKGSTFSISIPQTIISDERIGDYKSHKRATKEEEISIDDVEAPEASVLVVDDHPINLKVLSMLLAKTRMNVTSATSGQEALERMKEQRYDIILLDHMMPEMDGIETVKAAREMDGNMCETTPIIALTANAIVGAKEFYLEAGFDGYLSKPVLPPVLIETLVEHLPADKVIIKA